MPEGPGGEVVEPVGHSRVSDARILRACGRSDPTRFLTPFTTLLRASLCTPPDEQDASSDATRLPTLPRLRMPPVSGRPSVFERSNAPSLRGFPIATTARHVQRVQPDQQPKSRRGPHAWTPSQRDLHPLGCPSSAIPSPYDRALTITPPTGS